MRHATGEARVAALLLIAAAVGLSACSAEPDRPGAVTADEERQLNEAAEMLDANSMSADAFGEDGNDQ